MWWGHYSLLQMGKMVKAKNKDNGGVDATNKAKALQKNDSYHRFNRRLQYMVYLSTVKRDVFRTPEKLFKYDPDTDMTSDMQMPEHVVLK